jgi:hypothetical protein
MRPPREDAEADRLGRAFAHERTVFIVCASMVGVCLTGIGLIRIVERFGPLRTLSRWLLAVDALVFMVGALLSFAALRTLVLGRWSRFLPVADGAMLLGLVVIVVVCFTLVFTLA